MLKLVGVHFRRVGGEQGGGREHLHVQLKREEGPKLFIWEGDRRGK